MSEELRREFGRDGISGLVDHHRALRARLLTGPRRQEPAPRKTPPVIR
ncbi:MAG TPA: hypothetical protein PK963_03215 [Arachnia sp.]|nr:hypothetical protein [Arachnia sp.]